MPASIEVDQSDDYIGRLMFIGQRLGEFNKSVKDIHSIKVLDVVSNDGSEEDPSSEINGGTASAGDQSVDCVAYKILQSKINKMERKRTMWKVDKKQIEYPKIGTVSEATDSMSMIDQKNCEWKNVSRRTQRSVVIRYCNTQKLIHKLSKEILAKMKEEVLDLLKKGMDLGILYDSENEIIDCIDSLKVGEDCYTLTLPTVSEVSEIEPVPKKKMTIKVKKDHSLLSSDKNGVKEVTIA